MLNTLTNLDPSSVYLLDRWVNMSTVYDYVVDRTNLVISLAYLSGDTDLIRFGTLEELDKYSELMYGAQAHLNYGE
jgi:hypothetical protein